MVISINRSGGVMDVGFFCEWGDEFFARYAVSESYANSGGEKKQGFTSFAKESREYKVFESYMINILLAHG